MDYGAQLPTSSLAIYIGVFAGLVVGVVAAVMLRIYAWRHRMSTVSASSSSTSIASDGDSTRANSNALIATTLSVMGSPIPDSPENEDCGTTKTSRLSIFTNTRWQQATSFVGRICRSGISLCKSLRRRFTFQKTRSAPSKDAMTDARCPQTEIDIATPSGSRLKSPVTPTGPSWHFMTQVSSKFQLRVFRSLSSNTGDVGMI